MKGHVSADRFDVWAHCPHCSNTDSFAVFAVAPESPATLPTVRQCSNCLRNYRIAYAIGGEINSDTTRIEG